MLVRLFFFGFVWPISLLPFWFLYGAGSVFVFIAYGIFGYRKDVIFRNLKHSFPEKSDAEIESIAKAFYKHFGQLFAEGMKGFSISEKEILKRFKVTNPEILSGHYQRGKSVILVSGHQNNWEYFVQSLDLHFKHKGIGVGKDISSDGFGYMMNYARNRFGMTVWDMKNAKSHFKNALKKGEVFVCMLLADQSPSNHKKAFWMRFLNQDTATIFGPEYFAVKHDLPVYYYEVLKVKRGYYEATLMQVSINPKEEAYGDITYKHNKLLEESIKKQPAYWLWSHKRWKHSHHASHFDVRV